MTKIDIGIRLPPKSSRIWDSLYLSAGVDHTDSLRRRFRAPYLSEETTLQTPRRIVDQARFEGDRDVILVDRTYGFGIGKNRLTGRAREDSTSLVVYRTVDKYPKDNWLLLLA